MRKDEVEREKRQDKVQVVLDFSFLRKYMEDGGMVVQNLKCLLSYGIADKTYRF